MASRYFPSQFLYQFTHEPVLVNGSISLIQEVKAVKITQGLTLTAVAFGSAGNSITIAFTGGGTAGAEVVTVVGNAISVQIESGVSTVTQVRTAMQAAAACTALVTTTGTSGSAVVTAAALPLLTGADGVASYSGFQGIASAVQSGVGEITVTLSDKYNALTSCSAMLLSATAQDLVPQLKSADVVSAKTVVIRLLAGATATDPTSACTLYVSLFLRNSSVA